MWKSDLEEQEKQPGFQRLIPKGMGSAGNRSRNVFVESNRNVFAESDRNVFVESNRNVFAESDRWIQAPMSNLTLDTSNHLPPFQVGSPVSTTDPNGSESRFAGAAPGSLELSQARLDIGAWIHLGQRNLSLPMDGVGMG
ncbi:hypothetical protein HGM15179_017048 [Zosterops borbonicus]|uniref:Uncharacterized protein n=1 Tax=Zosterops borbonicus TaxID=364589 RepID=A0A8K1G1V6_9PASS|nr:hypothetical protein HGM15179_017048 [Zosterops borbonicus]